MTQTLQHPRPSKAHFAGTCACGKHQFAPGDPLYLYPAFEGVRARIYSGECAERALTNAPKGS